MNLFCSCSCCRKKERMITDKRFLPGPSPRLPKKNLVNNVTPPEPSPKMERNNNNNNRKPSNNDLISSTKLRFHEFVYGKNILITHRGKKASRVDGFYDGLTFSNRPLAVNETVTFRVAEIDRTKAGCLTIGCTVDDPERYRNNARLPSSAELLLRPGTKIAKLDERVCQKDFVINVRLTDHGDMHFTINDDPHEFHLFDNLDVSKPMWLLVDIFGRCNTLEIADSIQMIPGRKPEAKIKPITRQQSMAAVIQIGEYEYVEDRDNRLGQGTFGEVWKGLRPRDGVGVALKKLPFDPKEDPAELQVMETVSHPNLLKMFGTIRKGPYLYVITELCNMDYERFLKQHVRDGRLSLDNVRSLAKQLASAYIVLHAAEIIHRDIKPQNILVNISTNNKATVKIADFGCGKFMEGQLYANTVAGSVLYMAPELGSCWASKANYSHYDARADIWSLGLVIYESALGHLPYDQKTLLEFFVAAGKSPRQAKKMKPKIPTSIDNQLQKLLSKMLKPLYQERMQPTEFFQDEFHSHVPLNCHIFF